MASKKLSPILVLTTAGSTQEAKRLARLLLQERCAGCVNLIPKALSLYRWKGRLEQTSEVLMLIKTNRRRLDALRRVIKAHHSYEVPELIALPVTWGDRPYLDWLAQNLR